MKNHDIPAEIQSRQLPSTSHKHYHIIQLIPMTMLNHEILGPKHL
jgi:hypothetical protein